MFVFNVILLQLITEFQVMYQKKKQIKVSKDCMHFTITFMGNVGNGWVEIGKDQI